MSARTTYTKIQGKYVQKPYTTASTAATDTPRSRSYNTCSNIQNYNQKSTVDLGLPKIPGFTTCKIPYEVHTTLGNPESFTLD